MWKHFWQNVQIWGEMFNKASCSCLSIYLFLTKLNKNIYFQKQKQINVNLKNPEIFNCFNSWLILLFIKALVFYLQFDFFSFFNSFKIFLFINDFQNSMETLKNHANSKYLRMKWVKLNNVSIFILRYFLTFYLISFVKFCFFLLNKNPFPVMKPCCLTCVSSSSSSASFRSFSSRFGRTDTLHLQQGRKTSNMNEKWL